MSANNRQVAGDHYQSEYQPWDFFHDARIPYHMANAIKYVYRWRSKNGEDDLKKSIHYLEKCQEIDQKLRFSILDRIKFIVGIRRHPHELLALFLSSPSIHHQDRWVITNIYAGLHSEAILCCEELIRSHGELNNELH